MRSPRPYGLLVINGELTENDNLFIDHQLKKLSNQKVISNLESIRQVKDLPDGGYVILQDMGGMLKAIAHKELLLDEFESDGLAKVYVPMLYSGVITKARIRKEEGVSLKLTEQSRRRLINYSNETLPNKELNLQRFIIEPNAQVVPEFIPKNNFSDFIATQYVQQRPTWYSGAMAEVMQIVGGFGKQNLKELPENAMERAQFKIPDKYIERIAQEIEGIRLPAYSGVPPLDGAFQYDYKFYNTNGVVFDTANKPWLVRISSGGVYAMPLPIIPATATSAFREYVEEVGDDELLKILDRFGAMPSGEGFPKGQDFQSWRRAGVIIKVCDTKDFYSHIHYSPACGWSFNLNGTEGFNTCYTYDEDGIAIGKAYKIRLNFSPAENNGWLKKINATGNASRIANYLNKLIALLPKNTHKTNAILYKLRRVPQEDIYFQAETSIYNPLGVTSVDVDYWDNLEIEPIATLTGNLSLVAQGKLFHHAKPENQPQIKFPFVEMGGCVSFDFGAYTIPEKKPNCDTIMYGYYVGNSLKVIKYFVDWRGYQKQIESNYEPMMTVGSWEKTETFGSSSPKGYFYTTDFDFREVFSPVVTTTSIKGEDKGFDSQPFFSFDAFFWKPGSIWRNRYYTHLTKTNRTELEAVNLGICIPYFTRNSVVLAKKNTVIGITKSESLNLYAMRDPTSYRYWTYDFVFAWAGGLEKMIGEPYPVNGNPVWVEIENYNPSEYSDFADQGSWLPNLPYDITWLIHPDANQWNHSGGGGAPKVKEYSISNTEPSNTTGSLYFDISETPVQVHSRIPQDWYFSASPDEYGNVFYRDACKVVFGDSEYANISETDQNNRRYKWGYSRLVEHKSAYHFIGVINE
ncbi:hypothetical protein LZP46_07555 [Acinetobacter sp. SCLZS86]|uniref:hypothetical protein n=1 Tax=Acinetobacter sp. SCLZS86 TaxID=2908637 RepID=UPI001F22BCE5|nr:hypothetical protein [Acinetobacter sp. SCLZS86]UIZ56286.1 hypothetical protein LZP46_07555 [Acinetobacter sp. SCLZS86]